MTNETTASQPKSIGDDAQFQALVRAARKMLHRIDATGNKSVGFTYSDPLIDGIRAALVAIERAPAAQAPATIQPGQWVRCTPDLIKAGVSCHATPRRPGDGTYSHDHFIAHSATIQAAPDLRKLLRVDFYPDTGEYESSADGGYVKFADVEALLAATIQEPAMVAEPSEREKALERSLRQALSQNEGGWLLNADEISTARRALSLAAPMVADPAGVAGCAHNWRQEEGNFGDTITRCSKCGNHRQLAATVKAVPSEALERFTCIGKGGDYERVGTAKGAGTSKDIEDVVVYRDREDGALYYRTTIDFSRRMAVSSVAAPLADKKDGAA